MISCVRKSTASVFNHRFITTSVSKDDYFGYCTSLVKKRDYENYLCLLLQKDLCVRSVGFVTRAFNIELAQIQESTTELNTAKMRFDFWRRGINETFDGKPPLHPVTVALALTLEKKMLSKAHFHKLIDIRDRYISQRPFMSIADVEEYGEYSVSPIFLLLLEILDFSNSELTDTYNTVTSMGKLASLVTLIRSVPYFLQQRKVFLPTELCFKYSISQEDIIRNEKTEAVRNIICDIASHAKYHLDNVQEMKRVMPKTQRNIFLPVVPNELFLLHLERLGFNVYDLKLNRKQFILPLKLWLAS